MDDRLTVAVLFGGRSGEHDVSLVSGSTVLRYLDKSRYRALAVGITRQGRFASADQTEAMFQGDASGVVFCKGRIDSGSGALLSLVALDAQGNELRPDIFFPVLHGPYGEDGTIQGLVELTGKPLVGCSVAASAVGMDKVLTKRLARDAGLHVVPWVDVHRAHWAQRKDDLVEDVLSSLGQTCFVKPVRMGSSVGISKATGRAALAEAVGFALEHDYRVLVERALDAREIECAVMGNEEIAVSSPGEIEPSREFYDYEAKYVDGTSGLLVPAPLDQDAASKVRVLAARAFAAIAGEGFGRVDFLLERETGRFYLNEINTIPGFTEISMFPKLWMHDGYSLPGLLDRLIELGLARHAWRGRGQDA